MKIKVNGRYVDDFEYIMNFKCSRCDCAGAVAVVHNKRNNSLQVHCPKCKSYYGNFKYDFSGGADNATPPVSI